MSATTPFTVSDDYASLYINLGGGFGLPEVEKNLLVKNKVFDAGSGFDTLYLDASAKKIGTWFTLSASEAGVITVTNVSGGTVKIAGLEKLEFRNITLDLGTAANNALTGTEKNDGFLFGLAGNDTIKGLAGNDVIYGGTGDDILIGGSGDDRIVGGAGHDIMSGGTERDIFDFNRVTETTAVSSTRDVIKGFIHAADRIDLSTIDANAAAAGNQSFRFIATAKFHGIAGELNIVKTDRPGTVDDRTIVQGDINGDKLADFQIELTGLMSLTSADFIL
jgi:Ca2+-binding RTX toxin-like protein